MRVIGIDYGEKRTGIAVSDPFGWTAQGLEVVTGDANKAAARIAELIKQYESDTVVVGYPLNMNGSEGFMAGRTNEFITELQNKTGGENIKIIKWDERLSSAEAARAIKETGGRPTSRKTREKGDLDVRSAAIILQSYLDRIRND